MPRRAVTLHLVVLVGLLVGGLGLPARALAVEDEPPSGVSLGLATPRLAPLPRVDVQSPSLSPGGRTQLAKAHPADAPRSSVSARADPVTGEVAGHFRARFARPTDGALELRMLAGLPAYEAGLEVRDTTVNGRSVGVQRDAALLTIPTGRGRSSRVDVRLRFSYTVPLGNTTVGRFLTQATIGALARHRDALLLGHWFPLWIPPSADADPRLEGYGDIGNFAAGAITTRVQVPRGYEVFGPGTTIGEQAGKATTTITQSGVGLRDLALVVARGTRSAEVGVGEVTVRATAPAGIDVAAAALDAAATLQALEAAFGPYPWSRLEVIEVPLGPQVGGMEWPGVVWIDGFGADVAGGIDLVVAHELGHEWWHALVGNDSIAAPVVDEPLAQFSQCVAATARGHGSEGCDFAFAPPARGAPCLDRRTDAFGPAEYGDLVYGEAPMLYLELAELVGFAETVAALRGIAERHAFGTLSSAELREELAAALPERADEVRALWDGVIGPPGCDPGE